MRPILTDTSRAGLRAAIEADIVATRLHNADIPLVAHEEVDAAWALQSDGSVIRAVTAWASFDDATVERRLDEILGVVDEAHAGHMWWLAPHHSPADLGARLARRGFERVDDTAAMAMDLERLPTSVDVPPGVRIEPVEDIAGVAMYVELLMHEMARDHPPVAPDAAAVRLRHLRSRLGHDPASRRYVASLDGEPVATSRLSMAGGAAGLYTVLTTPQARGRGIGLAMTLTALLAGREAGMRIGALQATDMGFRLYRRLGFEQLFRYQLLARPRVAKTPTTGHSARPPTSGAALDDQ